MARAVALWACLALLLGCLSPIPARAAELVLSTAGDVSTLRGFADALAKQRPTDKVRVQALDDLPALDQFPTDARLVLFGKDALAWRLATSGGPPTLVMQISQEQAHDLLNGRRPGNLSLLWTDPAPLRQLRLSKLLLPHIRRVGVLYDDNSAFLLDELRQAAAGLDLQIVSQHSASLPGNRPLQNLLRDSDVLLGTAADRLYNAQTAKSLLLTSYAQQRALIGPSAGFVRAGSLASTYSDQADWLKTLDELLDQAPQNWPGSSYAQAFKVISNRQVARALAVELPDDQDLAEQLQDGETP